MLKKIVFTLIASTLATFTSAKDLTGTWQNIDDKTGTPKAVIVINQEGDGSYTGKIVKVTPRPGYTPREKCNNCPAPYNNQPILGMKILTGLQHVSGTNNFEKGRIIDPLAGKIYNAKVRLNEKGTRLTLRASIGVSALGRNQTWIRQN